MILKILFCLVSICFWFFIAAPLFLFISAKFICMYVIIYSCPCPHPFFWWNALIISGIPNSSFHPYLKYEIICVCFFFTFMRCYVRYFYKYLNWIYFTIISMEMVSKDKRTICNRVFKKFTPLSHSSWQNLEWRINQNAKSIMQTAVYDTCLQLQKFKNNLNAQL